MYDECHCRSELEEKPRWRAGDNRTKAQGAQRLVNDGRVCGGVNAARVQHARICPEMIANGLTETTDHARKPAIATKATAKSGRANT
jgi:sRNA-binding protein